MNAFQIKVREILETTDSLLRLRRMLEREGYRFPHRASLVHELTVQGFKVWSDRTVSA